MTCRHYACRCARAEELAQIADRTGDARFLAEAIAVHSSEVKCRQPLPYLRRNLRNTGEPTDKV